MASKTRPTVKAKPKQSGLVNKYLTVYNFASCLAWGLVLNVAISHVIFGRQGKLGFMPNEWASSWETLKARSASGYGKFGTSVKIVQTFALLEPLHIIFGLVRANLGTTVAQVASRLALVWGVLQFFPATRNSPFFAPMVVAWSISEIIRYMNYCAGLMDSPSKTLERLRYSLFYVLYPVGAGSEAMHIWRAQDQAEARFGPAGKLACQVLAAGVWPAALAFMMSHMHSQRRKHLRTVEKGKKRA